MHSIYALIDPRNQEVRYVGITGYHPKARLQGHLNNECNGNPEKTAWIKELRFQQLMPTVEILEKVRSYSQARHREMILVHEMLDKGARLTNVTRLQPFSFKWWVMGDYDAEIVSYRVAKIKNNLEYCVVGVIDERKCIYRFLDDHKIYTSGGTAYANCKKLNDRLKEEGN